MTQQNSPEKYFSAQPIAWTIVFWVLFGAAIALASGNFLIGAIAALSFAVGCLVLMMDFRAGASKIHWQPLWVLYSGALGLVLGIFVFNNPTMASVWGIVMMIVMRSIGEAQRRKK